MTTKTDKATGLARLREPFAPNQINKLPKPYRADSQKGQCRECGGFHGLPAVHLDYVGHAALTDRLLEVDPEWFWEPLAIGPDGLPQFDKDGGLWIRLTICGVTRLGYGDSQGKRGANAVKEAIGDALRNAGMRFGAALDLWHKGDLHDAAEEQGKVDAPAEEPAPARTLNRAPAVSEEVRKQWQDQIDECQDSDDYRALWQTAKADGAPEQILAMIVAAGKAAA
ncbi:hypothetical protein [Arthrobacter sp. FW306-06-A]|uniref:hypothetical protein n=1 Tax=Arthrobacter sp. FW306-06-A TaxID=2879621 RepID=UPI001F46D957|nr:hypothetical protein [Arthrobacter sp. FW306-06-A]UKA69548.1 hypothetical protein LFT49_12270 [Arthrobacter sp. FW306-06-A]